MELDLLDAKLIYLLGKNSRLSHSSLAKAIRTSREVINFRLNRLKDSGFFLGTTANVNYNLLGFHHIEILIKIRGASEQKLEQLEKFMVEHRAFTNVNKTFGRWDYLIRARAKDMYEITELLDEISTDFREVIDMESFLILEEHGPGWGMVLPDSLKALKIPKDRIAFTHCFDPEPKTNILSIDEVDKKILSTLSEDARINILHISKEAGINYQTAVRRISRMVKNGAIQSFDMKGRVQELGLSRRGVLLKLSNIRKNNKRANAFFNSMKECSRFWRFTGPMHYQLNVNVKTTEEFEDVLKRIRTHFGEDLLDIESVDVLKEIKRSGFPSDI